MRLQAIFVSSALLFPLLAVASPIVERDDLVTVPGLGAIPKSRVHEVPVGGRIEHVGDEVHVISQSGKLLHSSKFSGVGSQSNASSLVKPPVDKRALNGWNVAAWYLKPTTFSQRVTSVRAVWTVPPNPLTNHNQLLYLFDAMEPRLGNAIIQPVLQWGFGSPAGGGAFWGVASWYISPANEVFHTTLTRVNPGDKLVGDIAVPNSALPNNYDIRMSFTGTSIVLIPNSRLQIQFTREILDWNSVSMTLESYNTVGDDDFPRGSTHFEAINLGFDFGHSTAPGTTLWIRDDHDTTDKLTVAIDTNSLGFGEIIVGYPLA